MTPAGSPPPAASTTPGDAGTPLDALTLADVDRDGALEEAFGRLHGATRAGFLRGAVLGGGALLAAAATPAEAQGRRQDVSILNFALSLEYLQADFYTEVEQIGALRGRLKEQAEVVGGHERAHVRAFRDTLGRRAISKPRFDFRGATEDSDRFRRTAVAFEDLAVAAYKGQAPRLRAREYLVPALAIHSVEARHAAWIRRLAGAQPAADAFDEPLSRARTLNVVERTRFVVQTRRRRRSPRFTG
jgi:rubrerythrin